MSEQNKLRAEELAKVMKAMGHPERVYIMEQLTKREHTVTELVTLLERSAPTVSKHLALLKNVGLVQFRKEGTTVWYRSACECMLTFQNCASDIAREEVNRMKRILG